MSVVRRLGINRTEKVKLFDNSSRFEAERGEHGPFDCFFINCVRAERVDVNTKRLRMANGISELHFAFFRQTCRHHIFRNPASHVSSAAIDFARVFSRERPSAVPAHSTIGIYDDFAPGQTGVALWATDYKVASRIDEKLCLLA